MITWCICTSIFFSILFYQVTEATEDNNLIKHRDEYCKITNDHTLCKFKVCTMIPLKSMAKVINSNVCFSIWYLKLKEGSSRHMGTFASLMKLPMK